MDLKVMLAEEQDNALRKYFYTIAMESLQQARKDLSIDRDIVNKTEIAAWLDISAPYLDELMVAGLPYTLIGSKKYFFSKVEVRKWIIEYNK